jgi:hypothetical protein
MFGRHFGRDRSTPLCKYFSSCPVVSWDRREFLRTLRAPSPSVSWANASERDYLDSNGSPSAPRQPLNGPDRRRHPPRPSRPSGTQGVAPVRGHPRRDPAVERRIGSHTACPYFRGESRSRATKWIHPTRVSHQHWDRLLLRTTSEAGAATARSAAGRRFSRGAPRSPGRSSASTRTRQGGPASVAAPATTEPRAQHQKGESTPNRQMNQRTKTPNHQTTKAMPRARRPATNRPPEH